MLMHRSGELLMVATFDDGSACLYPVADVVYEYWTWHMMRELRRD
jgi:hypothetical protein